MYAVVETGGKQYKVKPGQILDVERMDVAEGDAVNLDRVLLFADDSNNLVVGNPIVNGAKVSATSRGNHRDKKVIVFKYKPKVRYSRKTGHRQTYTRLSIDSIDMPVK